jgi:hypothetical protein
MKRAYRIIRNHVITGFIFLMAVLISLAVIGTFWNKILAVGQKVSKVLRVDTLLGQPAMRLSRSSCFSFCAS